MKERPVDKVVTVRVRKQPGSDALSPDGEQRQKRRDSLTLGLRAFEKISAVEGIRLTDEMRKDLQSLDVKQMDEKERSRFIARKYGKA